MNLQTQHQILYPCFFLSSEKSIWEILKILQELKISVVSRLLPCCFTYFEDNSKRDTLNIRYMLSAMGQDPVALD